MKFQFSKVSKTDTGVHLQDINILVTDSVITRQLSVEVQSKNIYVPATISLKMQILFVFVFFVPFISASLIFDRLNESTDFRT